MTVETLLSRLDKPRPTGPGRWLVRCPAHEDRSPSLSVRELEDGRILVHCFTGCSTGDVLAAVGLEFSDLYPPRPPADPHAKPERRPFPALDILKALAFEVTIVRLAARDLLEAGDLVLGEAGFARLALASERIESALSYAEVRHG
ncbi:MAG: DNA primase [Candidatus Contendobacter sp.]|nr:DNA primase [Candidatus Contendobacter sp.]